MIYLAVPLFNLTLMIVEVLAVVFFVFFFFVIFCKNQAGWWSAHVKISQLLHMLVVLMS